MGAVPNNFVVFRWGDRTQYIYLRLDNDWTITPGVAPVDHTAEVPYQEFDRLGDKPGRTGRIEFYSTHAPAKRDEHDVDHADEGNPDAVIERITIVDAEPLETGYTIEPPARRRIVRYRLHLMDRRHAFSSPRGGFLSVGLVNGEKETQLRPNSQLIAMCLQAMGIDGQTDVTGRVDDAEPLRKLQWMANHAPTELARILDQLQCVFYVKADGTFGIDRVGEGMLPQIPAGREVLAYDRAGRLTDGMELPGIDRRAKVVVFTSAPMPVCDLVRLTLEDGLRLVHLEPVPKNGKCGERWTEIHQGVVLPKAGGALAWFKKGQPTVDLVTVDWVVKNGVGQRVQVDWTPKLRASVFHAVQVDPDSDKAAILRMRPEFLRETDQTDEGWTLYGKIARKGADGLWRSDSLQAVPVMAVSPRDSVILTESYLVGVDTQQGVRDLLAHAVELTQDDLVLQAWVGAKVALDDGKLADEFYQVGFRLESGVPVKLTPEELANAIADPNAADAIVVSEPTLRLFRKEGVDQNLADLETRAAAMAPAYLAGSGSAPKQRDADGWFPDGSCSGKICEVVYRQNPPTMTWKLNAWFLPSGTYFMNGGDRKSDREQGSDAFMNQASTQSQRGAEGRPESPEPMVAAGQALREMQAGAEQFLVIVTGPSDTGGCYWCQPIATPAEWKDDPTYTAASLGNRGADQMFLVCLHEIGTTEHLYATGTLATAQLHGRRADGTPIVVAARLWNRMATPAAIGSTGETEAADATAWTIHGAIDVDVVQQVRTAYNEAGDKTLYAYYRTFKYRAGVLVGVTEETRVAIDVTEAC